jgi:hypothetical protein
MEIASGGSHYQYSLLGHGIFSLLMVGAIHGLPVLLNFFFEQETRTFYPQILQIGIDFYLFY